MVALDSLPVELALLLEPYPDIFERLDESVLAVLEKADLERAQEVLEDLVGSANVRNPSAFVVASLKKHPLKRGPPPAPYQPHDAFGGGAAKRPRLAGDSELDRFLDSHPDIRECLDEACMGRLRQADPDRALEVLQDIASKGDVRNKSAFVATALTRFPHRRDDGAPWQRREPRAPALGLVDEALAQHPEVADRLDEQAQQRLRGADPERAAEVIREIALKGDVQNPSAFAVKALTSFAFRRGGAPAAERAEAPAWGGSYSAAGSHWQQAPRQGPPMSELDRVLQAYPDVSGALDRDAHAKLREVDPARAAELIQDIAAKGDVNNPSAFVVKALATRPHLRATAPAAPPVPLWEQLLSRHPHLMLDSAALQMLSSVEPARAMEIVQDLVLKPDVRNPSAFVSKALQAHPAQRGPEPPAAAQWRGPPAAAIGRPPAIGRPAPQWAPAPGPHHGLRQPPPRPSVDAVLARHGELAARLDEAAVAALREADPARAVEILEDIIAKGDVRNPSAFVTRALGQPSLRRSFEGPPALVHISPPPHSAQRGATWGPRGDVRGDHGQAWGRPPAAGGGARHAPAAPWAQAGPEAQLDEQARRALDAADPARAAEILDELRVKGGEVRNPSAFVARALSQYPMPRGRVGAYR